MHLPDHYLDPAVCAASAIVSAGALTWGALQARRTPQPALRTIIATTAVIFAAQIVNFPIVQGTSGHLLGGALAAILLGPWAAMFSLTAVLAVQCLLFGDGGVAALGANVLNMAVIAPLAGWTIYRSIGRDSRSTARQIAASACAGWASVVLAATACAVELGISGAHTLGETLWAMVSVHAMIGLGEASITAAVVMLVVRWNTNHTLTDGFLVAHSDVAGISGARIGWIVAAAVLIVLVPLASSLPDGLEAVATNLGFSESDADASLHSPLADYQFPGIDSPVLATLIAGVLGLAACAAAVWGCEKLKRLTARAR